MSTPMIIKVEFYVTLYASFLSTIKLEDSSHFRKKEKKTNCKFVIYRYNLNDNLRYKRFIRAIPS